MGLVDAFRKLLAKISLLGQKQGPGCFETKPAVDGPVLAKLGASRGGQVT